MIKDIFYEDYFYTARLSTLSSIVIAIFVIVNSLLVIINFHTSIPRFMLTRDCIELFSRPNRQMPFASSYLRPHCRSFASQEGFMTPVHVHDDTFRSYHCSGDLFSRNIDIRRVALTNIRFLKIKQPLYTLSVYYQNITNIFM